MTARVHVEQWVDEGDDPTGQDTYGGWDYYITVRGRTYFARRYRDDPELITFHYFSDPTSDAKDGRLPFRRSEPEGERREPFRHGAIPYQDSLFQEAVRECLGLDGVARVDVFTSNETGVPAPVDLSRPELR